MRPKYLYLFFLTAAILLAACSKKVHPVSTETTTVKNDTVATVKKTVIKKKNKEPLPKVITVNDLSAKKTVDGRYYYDLQGHRYWRNNKDGKYYLFNKAMYADDAFKPQ
jgi:hypothetical protein